jgi:hypothetical protein
VRYLDGLPFLAAMPWSGTSFFHYTLPAYSGHSHTTQSTRIRSSPTVCSTERQDKIDDAQVGIKSTALRFGSATKPILTAFTLAQLSLLTVVGVTLNAGIPFYVGVVAAGGLQGWMLWDVNVDDTKSCGKWFVLNVRTGGVIWLGCLAEWAARVGGLGLGEWFNVIG